VFSGYLRLPTTPAADCQLLFFPPGSGSVCSLAYVFASNKFSLSIGGGTAQLSTMTVTANAWYRFEFRVNWATNNQCEWAIAEGDGPAVTQTTATSVQAATSGRWIDFGSTTGFTYTCHYDDWIASTTSADYPLGPIYVLGCKPDSDGTHAVGSGTFNRVTSNGGSSVAITNGTTDAWQVVDEWPPTADSDGADDWVEKTVGAVSTERVEFALENPNVNELDPMAVMALAAFRNDALTTANNIRLALAEGATEHGTLIFNATIGSATTIYRRMIYTTKPSGGAWTISALSDTRIRLGSTDIDPVPRLKAVMLEVALVPRLIVSAPESYPPRRFGPF
jgi:hypothetical protein